MDSIPTTRRSFIDRQFTATAYIVHEERFLLIYHKKLQKWLPPGGHIDPNEIPSEAAIREAYEETGLHIELLSDEHLHINEHNARSFPRPYLCLIEEIPLHKDQPAHQHLDLIYIGKPIGGQFRENASETNGLRWFTLQEIDQLETEITIFAETKQVIRSIAAHYSFAMKLS